jgi:hypothetical protein
VEINDNLQTQASSPINGSINVDTCSTDIGRAKGVVCPISDGKADDIEARLLNLVKVLPGDERIPMATEDIECILTTKLFAKRVLCILLVPSLDIRATSIRNVPSIMSCWGRPLLALSKIDGVIQLQIQLTI